MLSANAKQNAGTGTSCW